MAIKKDIFAQARRDRQAGRDPGLQHLLSRHQRDRRSVTKRPDHVLGMHFFSPANVMRLLEVVRGDKTAKPVRRDGDADRQEDRQGRGAGRRLPRLRRQSHARPAPARGAEADPRRRDAVGRRPRALRFRHADGAVRDERSRRSRHRLVEGDDLVLDDARNPLRARTGAGRRPAPASTTTTKTATRAVAAGREDHPRFRRERRASTGARSPTRKFSNAASIR